MVWPIMARILRLGKGQVNESRVVHELSAQIIAERLNKFLNAAPDMASQSTEKSTGATA
jgi:hypothetical protein